ncbi:hypothetical protein [Helicobacter typhlonius]|uniref:hypothetical protein n=1 Tax=Helicobacter typhlonius TaxID=76936 RepID=UPI002FDF0C70
MDKHNEAKAEDFLTFFRSLDSKERDSFFEKVKEEYTEIKELESTGFIPAEQKYGMEFIETTKAKLEQSSTNSAIAKMKQKIEAFAQKGFRKEGKKENDMER